MVIRIIRIVRWLTISLFLLGALSLATYYVITTRNQRQATDQLKDINQAQKESITQYYQSIRHNVLKITHDTSVRTKLLAKQLSAEELTKIIEAKIETNNNLFRSYLVTDSKFTIISSTNPLITTGIKLYEDPYKTSNLARTSVESFYFGSELFSSYFSSPQTSDESLYFVAPLISDANAFEGLLIIELAIHSADLINQDTTQQSKWYLVEQFNKAIKIIVSNQQLVGITNQALIPENILQASLTHQGSSTLQDANDNTILASWQHFPELGWGLINTQVIQSGASWIHYLKKIGEYCLASALLFMILMLLGYAGNYLYEYRHIEEHEHPRRALKAGLLLLALFTTSVGLALLLKMQNRAYTQLKNNEEQKVSLNLQKKAQTLDYALFDLENEVRLLARTITNKDLSDKKIILKKLETFLQNNPFAKAAVAGWPLDTTGKIKAPTVVLHQNKYQQFDYDELYDFSREVNDPATAWYFQSTKTKAEAWHNPHENRITKSPLIGFGIASETIQSLALGCFVSLSYLDKLTADIQDNLNGITLLIDQKGTILYVASAGAAQQNQVLKILDSTSFAAISHMALKNPHGFFNQFIGKSKLNIWSQPLVHNNWLLVSISIAKQQIKHPSLQPLNIMLIATWVLYGIILVSLLVILFAYSRLQIGLSVAISIIFTFGIFAAWRISLRDNEETSPYFVAIETNNDIENYKDLITKMDTQQGVRHELIPTFITITNMKLKDDGSADISGTVAQDLSADLLKKITPGIKIIDADSQTFSTPSISISNSINTYTWSFNCKLSPDIDFHLFPLDVQSIGLKFENNDQKIPTILIPKFGEFDTFAGDNSVAGYLVDNAQIGYIKPHLDPEIENSRLPLVVLINLKRSLLYSFALYFIPLITIFLSLFGLNYLFQSRRIEGGIETVSGYITILFSLVLIHQSIRTKVISSAIVYIEYFIFLAYLINVGFIIMCLYESVKGRGAQRTFNNYLFWPLLTGIWFAITCLVFYKV